VHREYYLNDAGNQLDDVPRRRCTRATGARPPDDGYQAQYLVDMARDCDAELGDDVTRRRVRVGLRDVVDGCATTSPHRRALRHVVLGTRRCTSAATSPTCCACSTSAASSTTTTARAGCARPTSATQRDRVLVKSDGTHTYLCNDLAYHRDKFARGCDHLIDIWGADHHGQVKSLQSGMEALGFGRRRARGAARPAREAVRDGERCACRKRAGNIVTLADILDEVDPDVARMTFLLQGIDTAQTFDLDVVTAQSMENPVYYVQYAHARVASIERRGRGRDRARAARRRSTSRRCARREIELLRASARIPSRRERPRRGAAEGHHLGADFARCVPRLLPRLPVLSTTPRSRRRAVAAERAPHRARHALGSRVHAPTR
jgi:arginyl-tRNA synthetase